LARNLFKDIVRFTAIRQNNMNSTQRPVAIVTGASSGIGLGITLALIEHGYNVVGTSRTISKSKELKASADLVLIDGEISKKETAVKVAEAALKHFGRIDLLVNNAGIFVSKPFTEYTRTTTIWS
jgi:NAD(P)-dependent dehydrogenase (short-subunit alcohol dehydrogenase family)